VEKTAGWNSSGRGSGSRSDYNDVTSIAADAGVMDGIFLMEGSFCPTA
jgi:hypothetical protein